jgi:hypothetical protein
MKNTKKRRSVEYDLVENIEDYDTIDSKTGNRKKRNSEPDEFEMLFYFDTRDDIW